MSNQEQQVAAIIVAMPPEIRQELAREFSERFAASHPRFDRIGFLIACGVVR